jgi:hypothetical protein
MLILHGSLGLGDAVYMWPVVKYYSAIRDDVVVVTRYPELYATLKCQTVHPEEIQDCHCSARTLREETNIYEDTLIMSGIESRPPLEINFEWTTRKYKTSKPVCVVRTPSFPVKGDESARCMVPNPDIYQRIINAFRDRVYFVSIGWAVNMQEKLEAELDLTEIKALHEYFSALAGADLIMTQPGHCVPIAEAMGKPLLTIFSAPGLVSQEKRYRFTTPKKILTKPTSHWIVDDDPIDKIFKTFTLILEGLHAPI